MVDHSAMRTAVHNATHHEQCSCVLQERIKQFRLGRNATDVNLIYDLLLERIDELEVALDEVGNALVSIIGESENKWDQRYFDEGTAVLLDLACETFEHARFHE